MDPAADGSQFITLIELLDGPTYITVGQLASAIEKGGVYGWDRFGRFKKSDDQNAIKKDALNALAELMRDVTAWNRDPKHCDPEEGLLDEFPLNDLHIEGAHPLQFFGWPKREIPKFCAPEGAESAPFPSHLGVSTNALYNIIGALLDVASTKRERPMTEAQLIGYLVEKYENNYGISKSNLEKQFARAKRMLDRSMKDGTLKQQIPP